MRTRLLVCCELVRKGKKESLHAILENGLPSPLAMLDDPHRPVLYSLGLSDLGFSRLYQAYCNDFSAVARFYAADWQQPEARAERASVAARHPRNREALADALLGQNARWGLDTRTRANIERLRDPESVAILTGQQVGLFGGPLYTIYKAITAIQLARQTEAETGRLTVPVFWLADEDHDFAEISRLTLHDGPDVLTLQYDDGLLPEVNRGAVGRLVSGPAIERILAAIEQALPQAAHTQDLIALLRQCYRPDTSLRDGFAILLKRLLPGTGLVLVSPDDPAIKVLAAPLFAKEVSSFAETHARFVAQSGEVAGAYHAQVQTGPLKLFLLEEKARLALEPEGEVIRVKHSERVLRHEELKQLVHNAPEKLSPNVVLRPIVQDALFPTAAYIAGPGETAYFAQLQPLYDFFGVPMPVIYPRASVTLLEPKVQKVLARYDLPISALRGDTESLLRKLVVDQRLDSAFDEVLTALEAQLGTLAPLVLAIDASLDTAIGAARAKATKAIEALRKKTVRVEKKNHEAVRIRLETAAASLFPHGHLQERELSALPFLNRYGLDLPLRWLEALSLATSQHQVVEV